MAGRRGLGATVGLRGSEGRLGALCVRAARAGDAARVEARGDTGPLRRRDRPGPRGRGAGRGWTPPPARCSPVRRSAGARSRRRASSGRAGRSPGTARIAPPRRRRPYGPCARPSQNGRRAGGAGRGGVRAWDSAPFRVLDTQRTLRCGLQPGAPPRGHSLKCGKGDYGVQGPVASLGKGETGPGRNLAGELGSGPFVHKVHSVTSRSLQSIDSDPVGRSSSTTEVSPPGPRSGKTGEGRTRRITVSITKPELYVIRGLVRLPIIEGI